MHPLHLLVLAASLSAAAPLPQFNAHGYKPYQESFFGSSRAERQAFRNLLTNPYINPYGLSPAGYGPSYYGAPYSTPNPAHHQHHLPPSQGQYDNGGFTAPGEHLPPFALEPVLEPIDLMSAPKHMLPKRPSPEEEEEEDDVDSENDGNEEPSFHSSNDNFLKPAPSPTSSAGEMKKEAGNAKTGIHASGVAGTGWYLDAARRDHKVGRGVGDMRGASGWAEKGERNSRFNPRRGGGLGYVFGGLGLEGDEKEGKAGDAIPSDGEEEGQSEKGTEKKEEKEKKKQEPMPMPMPTVEVKPAQDGRLKYDVNIGGLSSYMRGGEEGGEDGEEDGPDGPSNYHTWTQEGTRKLTGNSMDPECQKYIQEKMLPKLSGKRKKGARGGCVFSVFGDD